VLAGRYELHEELGRGAHGVVFRAHDRVAGTDVAIKSLGALRRSRIAPERLRRELRAAWNVTHPGVVRIHDVIFDGEHVALSMQLLAGETLGARLARTGKLTVAEVARLAGELASALAAAHDAGVVHRDLKPSNILIVGGGRAVITDFGLSRIPGIADDGRLRAPLDAASSELTHSGELVGTPAFMAPEQLRGASEIGPAADVYAFGLVMFEAATGGRPHATSSVDELMRDRLHSPAPPVAARRRDLPRMLARVIDDSLAIEPASRIRDGRALVARLTPRSRARWIGAAALALALVAAAITWRVARRSAPVATTARVPGVPALSIEQPTSGPLQLVALVPGSASAIVQRAIRHADGSLLLVGHATGSFAIGGETVGGSGPHFGYVIAVAPDGTVRWHRELVSDHDVQLVDGIETSGMIVVSGAAHDAVRLGGGVSLPSPRHVDFSDGYLAAFDARDGTPRWAVPVGASSLGHTRELAADDHGNIYCIGEFAGEASFGGSASAHTPDDVQRGMFVASYRAADGGLRWVSSSSDVGGTTRGFAIVHHEDDVVIGGMFTGHNTFAGTTIDATAAGAGVVAVLDASTGAVRRSVVLAATGATTVSSIAIDDDGTIAVAGSFAGTFELAPGHPLTARSDDAFVALLAPDTTPRWAVGASRSMYDTARSIAFGPRGIVAVGRFNLDLTFGNRTVTSAGGNDIFVVELAREDGAVRSLLRIGGADSDRARTVSVTRDGAIGVTGTFRHRIEAAGRSIEGPGEMNGFALELRPPAR